MLLPLTSRIFGTLPDGKAVEAWTLCGSGGLRLEIITYGAAVTRLLVPDRDGRLADVVLGFNNLAPYATGRTYSGAVIGRVAGRMTGARFSLDGIAYQLTPNDGLNHLHGGSEGFDKKVWTAFPMQDASGAPSLRLTYRSTDGEEGYPGNVDVAVIYTVTGENVVRVETEAVSDRPTPFNLTLHPYFNLAGEAAGPISDHLLQIHSDEFVATDEQMTLLGRLKPVNGQHNDFRTLRGLGDAVPLLFRNHGDLYRIRRTGDCLAQAKPVPAARLVHPASGRVLELSTTESYVQLYTGVGLDGLLTGKSGTRYARHAGVCLECEGYPDGANSPGMGDNILRPGKARSEITTYSFSTLP
jgi:aldose 1-epimerase